MSDNNKKKDNNEQKNRKPVQNVKSGGGNNKDSTKKNKKNLSDQIKDPQNQTRAIRTSDEDNRKSVTNTIQKKQKKKSEIGKAMNNYQGKAYENFSIYKICHKIFLEDIKNINASNINSNKEFEFEDTFKEIIAGELRMQNPDKTLFQEIQGKLYDSYINFKNYNKNFYDNVSDYEISSGYEGEADSSNKSLNKIEFDLILKNTKGKYIINYLQKMGSDNYQFINSFDIKENEDYNLCFEATISSKDVLRKKIPQILKYVFWLNFIYEIYSIFDKIKLIQENLKLFSDFFKNKFKYLNLSKKTLLFIVSNGDKKDFEKNVEALQNPIKTKLLTLLKEECSGKYNLYFNYSAFDYEEFRKNVTDKIYNKEESNKNEIIIKEEDKNSAKEKLDSVLEKMAELVKENKEMKELMQKRDDETKKREEEEKKKREEENKKMKEQIENMKEELNKLKGIKEENKENIIEKEDQKVKNKENEEKKKEEQKNGNEKEEEKKLNDNLEDKKDDNK